MLIAEVPATRTRRVHLFVAPTAAVAPSKATSAKEKGKSVAPSGPRPRTRGAARGPSPTAHDVVAPISGPPVASSSRPPQLPLFEATPVPGLEDDARPEEGAPATSSEFLQPCLVSMRLTNFPSVRGALPA
jgi:hypothetical protein